ncbi:hypothetical protein HPB50_024655 [Hyalomma asiaticum]|uniref:Uncharacterized protein n=1 Tax=Hyalomma asiaticum TaxID=266040 RepID=A0ACB7SZJ1_HYAAI|nr:hypothetical protein HPB50_024655 [Hyalomma asiaticum]
MVQSQREIVLAFMEQYPELAQKASELQHGLTLALNAQDPVTKLLHSGRTGGKKKCTKPATMPFSKLKVTGTSRVGGLQVGTLYQEILRRIVQLMSSIVVLAHKEAAARERAAAQEGIMSELHSLAQTMALQQERN